MSEGFLGLPSGASAQGIAILLWSLDPDDPVRLATPFVQASAASALEVPVEMYFTARSVHLLVPGIADQLRASSRFSQTIGQTMRQAHEHGVRFFACTDAVRAHGINEHRLIPECVGHGGAVQFMARAADLRWRTLVF